jgi:hypothetical protein
VVWRWSRSAWFGLISGLLSGVRVTVEPVMFGIRRSDRRGTVELLDAAAVHVGPGVIVHPVDEPDEPVAADAALLLTPTAPRLTVALVPATCWYANVRTAVTQGDWDRIRHRVYDRAGHRCEICGGHGRKPRVHCHEIWTYDDHRHIQRLVDLIALCPYCHEVKHLGHANTSGHGDRARRWLGNINHWTAHQADAYLEHQFAIWEHRSRHDWQTDMLELAAYGVAVGRAPIDQLDPDAVQLEVGHQPPDIGQPILHPELGPVTCELVCAIDRSHQPPITTIVVAPADDGTLLAVHAQLQARDRSGERVLDWLHPGYLDVMIERAAQLRAGRSA